MQLEGSQRRSTEEFGWTVAGISESECPVSAITQASFELVQIVNTLERANKGAGSALPIHEMPGHLIDAIQVCQAEAVACENAMGEAANT